MKVQKQYLIYVTLISALFLIIFNLSCKKDDINKDDSENLFSYCKEVVTIIGLNDEVSISGLPSADSLLSWTGHGFTTNAQWTEETDYIIQSPINNETVITVVIYYEGGEIRQIDSKPIEGLNEIALDCQPRIEIEVKINFITQDGAFNENWDGILSKSVSYQTDDEKPINIYAEFNPTQINGYFDIISISGPEPDWVKAIFNSIIGDDFKGEIQILVQQSEGDGVDGTVSFFTHTALSWEK